MLTAIPARLRQSLFFDDQIKRNVPLDAIRGMAALAVVILHYRNSFMVEEKLASSVPLGQVLIYVYSFGTTFVDLFFCLSGFIFSWKYAEVVKNKGIDFKSFMILRLTRLYPLIVASLVLVAVLNYLLLVTQGRFYIFKNNDVSSFFANLLFLQDGFLQISPNFNRPAWSLSVEFFLYVCFFFVVLKSRNYVRSFVLIALFGLVLTRTSLTIGLPLLNPTFGRGLASFFIGALIAYVYVNHVQHFSRLHREIIGLSAAAVAVCCFIGMSFLFLNNKYAQQIFLYPMLDAIMVMNPAMVIALVVSPSLRALFSFKPFKFIGDISYSIYLLHIPVQLMMVCVYKFGWISFGFSSAVTFWAYVLVCIAVAALSYYAFEKPMMTFLRRKYLPPRAPAASIDEPVPSVYSDLNDSDNEREVITHHEHELSTTKM